MGCFLSCFRGGLDHSGNLRDPLVRESRLGDAFLNDEKKFAATGGLDAAEAVNGAGVDEELLIEANYLKSCGTISQTPPEILEIPTPINPEDTNECNDTSIDVQLTKDTTLLEGNLSEVLNSDKNDILSHEQNVDEGTLRVDPESQSSLQDKPLCQNARDQSTDYSDSPYPTPLVIRGDIQTPGTVFSSYKDSTKPGKRTRASRQFIYPVLRPIENKMQWMELKAESPVLSSNPPKRRNLSADPIERPPQTCASSTVTKTESSESESFPFDDSFAAQDEVASPEEPKGQNVNEQLQEGGELPKQSSEHGKHGVSSLSYWLKPSSADDGSDGDPAGNVGKEPCYEEKSLFDVPLFPALGLSWENDNPTPVLPKAWDGNGIPNTTTKYKEDQKVSWHATPFEERLLKVLSEEKPRHERKISGKLIHLEETAE